MVLVGETMRKPPNGPNKAVNGSGVPCGGGAVVGVGVGEDDGVGVCVGDIIGAKASVCMLLGG